MKMDFIGNSSRLFSPTGGHAISKQTCFPCKPHFWLKAEAGGIQYSRRVKPSIRMVTFMHAAICERKILPLHLKIIAQ